MAGAVAIRRFAVSSQQISIGIECWKRGLGEAGKRPCTEQVAQSALRFPLGIAARRCEAEAGAMGRHPCKHTRANDSGDQRFTREPLTLAPIKEKNPCL